MKATKPKEDKDASKGKTTLFSAQARSENNTLNHKK